VGSRASSVSAMPFSRAPCLFRHPCESRGPICIHMATLASLLDSCLRRNDGPSRTASARIPRHACLFRHPCESRGPVCAHMATLASPLDSCLRRNDGGNRAATKRVRVDRKRRPDQPEPSEAGAVVFCLRTVIKQVVPDAATCVSRQAQPYKPTRRPR